jgi:hypothetical protein
MPTLKSCKFELIPLCGGVPVGRGGLSYLLHILTLLFRAKMALFSTWLRYIPMRMRLAKFSNCLIYTQKAKVKIMQIW